MPLPEIGFDFLGQFAGLIATVAGTVLGAIATLFIQASLPDRFKVKVRYYAGYLENRLLRGDISLDAKLVRSYELDKRPDLFELSNDLWEEFGAQATGMNDHFEFTRVRGGAEYNVDVRLSHEQTTDNRLSFGGIDEESLQPDGGTERVVTSVRIEVSGKLPYSNLKNLLFRAYDLQRDIESEIPAYTSGGTYSLTCCTGQPPVINGLLSQMDFTKMKASNNSIEFECRDGEFTIRNLNKGEVDQMIDSVHKMVTIFA